VTGKGATGAGLTATVVKDEFLRGWALEAGALVLASGGIGCVDELDKMGVEDRSAMHEVMEQQTVSVSKANVQATLKAQVAILGAANPKYGRFDPYQPIADQINMPDTLLSRFDLIFAIRDVPDAVKDSKLAEHILWLHKDPTGIKPIIPVDTMRKYIAYARKGIHPVITEEAVNEVKSFFVGLRSKYSSEENQSVPISPRQLEALVRLTEASAKMRLSNEATKEDAQRAIDLLKFCLYQVGVDPETGKLDIDRLEGVTTASKRGKIMVVFSLLKEMEEQFQGPVPKFELIEKAKEKGVPADAAERLIEEMKMKGDIYEPRSGFIQKL
jgi:replicative DNA helicase Mcm